MQCSWANAACWIFPGLCRTCEIFGVNELVVSNLKLLEEKQFQSLSVTAEKWIKITEVSEFHRVSPSSCVFTFSYVHQVKLASLREYLLSMRGQSYSLVGVEQTAQSKCITKYQFQRKTVLVLGCVCTYYMNCHIWCGDNNRDLHIGNCMIKKTWAVHEFASLWNFGCWLLCFTMKWSCTWCKMRVYCALQCGLFSAVCTVYIVYVMTYHMHHRIWNSSIGLESCIPSADHLCAHSWVTLIHVSRWAETESLQKGSYRINMKVFYTQSAGMRYCTVH